MGLDIYNYKDNNQPWIYNSERDSKEILNILKSQCKVLYNLIFDYIKNL